MQTPPRAEALEDIVRARAGGDEFGFGRAFEIRAAKAQGALKATVLVQHHPRRDQRRPWQMIGEPVGAIAIFAQVQHARYPRWRRWRARTGAKSGSRWAAKNASEWPNAHIARPETHGGKPRQSEDETGRLTIAIARGGRPRRSGAGRGGGKGGEK